MSNSNVFSLIGSPMENFMPGAERGQERYVKGNGNHCRVLHVGLTWSIIALHIRSSIRRWKVNEQESPSSLPDLCFPPRPLHIRRLVTSPPSVYSVPLRKDRLIICAFLKFHKPVLLGQRKKVTKPVNTSRFWISSRCNCFTICYHLSHFPIQAQSKEVCGSPCTSSPASFSHSFKFFLMKLRNEVSWVEVITFATVKTWSRVQGRFPSIV